MKRAVIQLEITHEHHIVQARQRARLICEKIGFDKITQTRLSTAVSEIARNAYKYAKGGTVSFFLDLEQRPQQLLIQVQDHGKGIANLNEILEGRYVSRTGMGMGIIGAKRLVDHFTITTQLNKGTTVEIAQDIPARPGVLSTDSIAKITEELFRQKPEDLYEEIQQQNQELLRSMNELKAQQEELKRLNKELTDTNRGLLSLYSEINEKSEALKHANEIQRRFMSSMSHEFRSPLNTIISLTRILQERIDGDLTPEQEKQVLYIKKAAEDLTGLINDILDLGKLEAQKITVKPGPIQIEALFSTLRGMLKPLLVSPEVELIFEEPQKAPLIYSDEGKISQILRNLVSNAIKFTEKGEIRVCALVQDDLIQFIVSDTGIGIPEDMLEAVFQPYIQVDTALQQKHRGTGLGLSISKDLAEALGGTLSCASKEGQGSVFTLTLPLTYKPEEVSDTSPPIKLDTIKEPILIVEDDESTVLLYQKFLNHTGYQALSVRTITQAKAILEQVIPRAIVLDILLQNENGWDFVSYLKSDERLQQIPIIIISVTHDSEQGVALGVSDFLVKPVEKKGLYAILHRLSTDKPKQKALIIDDDESARYIILQLLQETKFTGLEAENGTKGIELAEQEQPDLIFLDLVMPEMDGFTVLEALKSSEKTKHIPVVISTSKVLEQEELQTLKTKAALILTKNSTSTEDSLQRLRSILENRP